MNNINNKDIITALATPYGKSAVAIIRVSGDGCIEFVDRYLSRKMNIGKLQVNKFVGEKFSERLMAVCYKAPQSYTGQDVVELFPHGNMIICDGIIKTLLNGGARLAERGEFTKRAFLNGKVDLMQCEALADIIDSQTSEQLNYGNARYDGDQALEKVEKLLNKALSSIEAVLHYSDELEDGEIDDAIMKDVNNATEIAIEELEKEVNGFAGGRIINDGFKIALIGEPNVGKSTLLNALTDSDRAIVTDIAGTTRDTVEGEFVYNDRKFIVTDTAGIREKTNDEVEKIGISRAHAAAKAADAIVFVTTDGELHCNSNNVYERTLTVINKCDDIEDVGIEYSKAEKDNKLEISAKTGKNITALKQMLYDLCPKDYGAICNHRQYECAVRCLDSLKAANIERDSAGGLEIVAALLYEAYSAIKEMYGEQADESVITSVFERFCVGK